MPSEVTAHCVRDNIGENIATFAVDCGLTVRPTRRRDQRQLHTGGYALLR